MGEVKIVQPLTTGVVRSIRVAAGDYVKQGQVLMEIDPSDIDPELESLEGDFRQAELEIRCLECLLAGEPFDPVASEFDEKMVATQRQIFDATRARLEKQVQVKLEALAEAAEELAAERKVVERTEFQARLQSERLNRLRPVRNIVSRDEFDEARTGLAESESQLEISRHRIEALLAGRERIQSELELIREEERSRLLNELSEKRWNRRSLEGKIQRARYLSTCQQIVSPVSGHVVKLLVHTVGGVVTPAEKLALVVPSDSPLLVKALVLNQDVGFITQGMPVSIKIDAFNFQKYGTIDGKVLQVSKDSIEDEHLGLVYETYIRPDRASLTVEGTDTPITTGMSVTTEIKVGKRRIIEFFIYPLIKYLDEGISVR